MLRSLFADPDLSKLGCEVAVFTSARVVNGAIITVPIIGIVQDLEEVAALAPLVGAEDVGDEDLPGMV